MIVATSVAPLADFARHVGGRRVRVENIVQSGANPHTYQLTTDQMDLLSRAKLLIINGAGLEFWAKKAVQAASNPELIVVETADGIPLVDKGEDSHPGGNPHVWLNPKYAIKQVNTIRDAFIKADQKNKAYYTSNAAAYVARLRDLDNYIRCQVRGFRTREFVAFHPSWVYFANEYGLKQAAAIEESPGKEPPIVAIRRIVDKAKRANARVVFAEPQFSTKIAQAVADEVGAKVLVLDPLGKPGDSYIALMKRNVREMAKALR